MKRVFGGLAILSLTFAACNKEVPAPAMTKQEVNRRIDSLSKIRIQEVNYRAQKELEHRIKIELKVKVDSILYIRDSITRAEAAKADTVKIQ